MRIAASLLFVLTAMLAVPAAAQESQFQSTSGAKAKTCARIVAADSPKQLVGCVVTVATADPFHVAIGSLRR